MTQHDVIIAGAGLCGASAARALAERGFRVLVLERRDVPAGNAYDCLHSNGVRVQRYGAHLFHTDSSRVFNFLRRFADFYPYRHRVRARLQEGLVPVPFQFAGIRALFPPEQASRLLGLLKATYREGERVPIRLLRQSEDPDVRALADFIHENIFRQYTLKQWGTALEQLDPGVGDRVPVLMSEADGYFADAFQFMPRGGFTQLVQRMLRHPAIECRLSHDARESLVFEGGRVLFRGKAFSGHVIYTGCVDELFGFRFGRLPYRSLRFDFQDLDTDLYQPCGVVNYTVSENYTRILEFKHFMEHPPLGRTTLAFEYPLAHDGQNEPFYPIAGADSEALHNRYRDALRAYPRVHLAGRLAEYRYLNMDQAVLRGLETAQAIAGPA